MGQTTISTTTWLLQTGTGGVGIAHRDMVGGGKHHGAGATRRLKHHGGIMVIMVDIMVGTMQTLILHLLSQ